MNPTNLIIEHYPNTQHSLDFPLGLSYKFKVDINQAVNEKLCGRELTNELALTILKQIKWESQIKSSLINPWLFVPLSAVTINASYDYSDNSVMQDLFHLALASSVLILYSKEPNTNFLRNLSDAYGEQAERAESYIRDLENRNRNVVLRLR